MKIPIRSAYFWVLIVVFFFLFGNGGFRKMVRRYWEIHKLKGEIVQLKKENSLLKQQIYLLEDDPSYIERIARKELGLISAGEVEYRFEKEK
jgi:cell division protein FtsB